MKRRLIALVVLTMLAGHVQAFPVEAITSFFKLFKGGGTAAKEAATAATAGRSADEGATAAKGAAVAGGMEHLPATDALRTSPILQTAVEPKPNLTSEPTGRSARDVSTYKTLRDQAAKGDTKAMVRMSTMTSTGKVSDPGEPYSGYWTFQAARAHDQAAIKMAQADCKNNEDRRRSDMWLDSECSNYDGKLLYSRQPSTPYFPLRPLPAFPAKQ